MGIALAPPAWFIVLTALVMPVAAYLHVQHLRRRQGSPAWIVYLFLLLDPLLVTGVLVLDPATFAFANPFVLIVIIRSGIRYGLGTFYLSWIASLLSASFILMSAQWLARPTLTATYLLLLLVFPLLFAPLVRRIHEVRRIEEERARLVATNEAVVARSAFLSKVSHELRSPLQGMVSALDVLEMRHLPSFAGDAELIGRMRRASLLLNTQLRDLLTLAKGEAGRLVMRPEPFEAGELVEALCGSARPLAVEKGLELVVELPAEPVFVVADGARIDQVLTNLVINSIRYTERGRVQVRLYPRSATTGKLRVRISDTGGGIAEAELPTLFTPDRNPASTARRGEGSGIGLAIVRTLVEQLAGSVSVTSRLGDGTTFDIEIPAEPVREEADARAAPARDAARPREASRVLVVDDRADVLAALASVIDEIGFACDEAASAAVAANLLASRRYEVVLLDIEMPGKGGVELAAEARRDGSPNRAARFVAMSAAEPPAGADPLFDAWLTKPIDSHALQRTVLGPQLMSRPSQPALWAETVSPSPAALGARRPDEQRDSSPH